MSPKSAPSSDNSKMLISYTPGEECRVAIVENGQLEEFHAERASSISRVGNIYVGTVTNVEPAIQAAFVDFGIEHHGFLHVTDVHPRYFPGENEDDTTESIGRKTPRRERPPIQRCFRRGDQVEVQVLKEGVGTKGPTLTSYLSIPGRFLVMMPQMDKVGVSRKVEDEDQRREMRQILDQLELPEGFGFILRTAGMDRTKLELKRDLAYLQRLWKDMETRKAAGNKPRLLYSESDLLVRALRDILTADIEEVVIDNELALTRAARFLKIVAPRSKTRLLQYQGHTPVFHAFGVEQQIAQIHAREVPLPSGGRIVIDETEALVAIDVNSGKSRESRDAETNAYHTNLEAVDVICRQLKLRDLGGIVINDLIDMRHASHRKDVEQRFRDRLKRDRAKTTVLGISDFGILEMTRQRMRGSHESIHFTDCPVCHGRGLVQKPDSVAGDALRNLAALLGHARVAKVEMVVNPRVAGELLSGQRKTLNKLERSTGKSIDVRVLETNPVDRITFYAYDEQGADIEIDRLPAVPPPTDLKEWVYSPREEDESWSVDIKSEQKVESDPEFTESEQAEIAESTIHPIELDEELDESGQPMLSPSGASGEGGSRRGGRRRRGRRGRGTRAGQGEPGPGNASPAPRPQNEPSRAPAPQGEGQAGETPRLEGAPQGEGGRRRRRRRGRRGRGGGVANGNNAGAPSAPLGDEGPIDAPEASSIEPAQSGAAINDDGSPRGDSWDLDPASVTPRAARSQPAPRHEASASPPLAPDVEAADEGEEDDDGGPTDQAQNQGQPDGQGGGRRRRRRGRRGRGRGGQGGPNAPGALSPSDVNADHVTPAPSNPPARDRESQGAPARTGGGYQKRPAPSEPAAPDRGSRDVAPPATPSAPAASPPPTPETKPMRFLYSNRRKLSPGEAAKQPRRE